MKVRNTNRCSEDKVELQMTPMIDIVFQLLVFFIMTFKIVTPEGDFNIKMPKDAPSDKIIDDMNVPIVIALKADGNGDLTHAKMDDATISGSGSSLSENHAAIFAQLRQRVRNLVPDAGGPGAEPSEQEVELDCDTNLKFKYVIDAITAVSGYVDENKRVKKIIEKIKFSKKTKPKPE